MSFVVINAVTVAADRATEFEDRFAARAGEVGKAPGFEAFELLRPVEGTTRYLVYTRWRARADFEAWRSSHAFAAGHGRPGTGEPVATATELWQLETVQAEYAS